ncbi:hypothetical protein HYW46_00415 [Candidatus Daviesbacteria bacterium]|nr:hypothetical protein [Candidatus Daviesbacteria bacterium]
MGILESLLVILVSLWIVIFAVIALILLAIFFTIKRGLKKADKIMEETEYVARRVDLPSKIVIASILAFLAKNSLGMIKDLLTIFLPKGRKKI